MNLVDILILIVKVVGVLSLVLSLATLMTWVERKQSAVMQDRLGANRADILGLRLMGLFQPFADAIKMITKEDFVPPFANRTLHLIAPAIAFFCVLVVFAAIPWGPPIRLGSREITLQIASIDIGLLYILAFGGLAIYGTILGGWSSNNKYALLGSLRATAQMISYEVCLGLSLIGAVLVYGTLDLAQMVEFQSHHWWGWLPRWGIFLQPLAVFLFLPAAMAENKRVPFDLPEAESEIVGYYTEYSGLRAGLFMMAEF
ncbi:MAG: complex I subunit 1/NuoH family protein, partial [bacterium]